MSILTILAQMDPTMRAHAIAGGAAVLAMLLAGFVGVHHDRSIVGPERLTDTDRLGPLWFAAAIGFYSLYIPGSIYVLTRPEIQPATAPATQIAPRVSALLSLAGPAAVLLGIFVTNMIIAPNWRNRLGLRLGLLPRGILAGLIAIVIVLPLMYLVTELTQQLWIWVGREHPQAHALLRAMNEDRDPTVQRVIMFSAIVMAPVSEELLFRGLLQTAILYSLSRNKPGVLMRWAAILITSGIFTLYHPELWMMPPIFVLSVFLGYLYERTGNLWSCMFLHAGFNAANVFYWLYNRH